MMVRYDPHFFPLFTPTSVRTSTVHDPCTIGGKIYNTINTLSRNHMVFMNKENIAGNPLYVLAVDDEELNLDIMEEYFEEAKINSYMSDNGLEALKILEEGNPVDVIVLDRMMPLMDGIEFLKKIKENKKYNKIPVIMQTAAGAGFQVMEGVKEGAFYYLVKPYSKEMLINLINTAADFRKSKK
jgi:CheY-like chemotaxis protein